MSTYVNPNTGMPPRNRSAIFAGNLVSLGILGLWIYVLAESYKPDVLDACGRGLWNVVLVDVIISGGIVLVIFVAALVSIFIDPCAMLLVWFLYCFVDMIMFSLDVSFSVQALGSSNCTSAMSSATSMNAPMLAVVALISGGFRGLYLLLVACACLCGGMEMLLVIAKADIYAYMTHSSNI